MAFLMQFFRSWFSEPHFLQAWKIAERAEPGDFVEIDRGSYIHYALSVGEGKVIIVDVDSVLDSKAIVNDVSLVELADGSGVQICNYDETAWSYFQKKRRSREDTVKGARKFLNKKVPYELLLRNREYYCTLWKYGKASANTYVNGCESYDIQTFYFYGV